MKPTLMRERKQSWRYNRVIETIEFIEFVCPYRKQVIDRFVTKSGGKVIVDVHMHAGPCTRKRKGEA